MPSTHRITDIFPALLWAGTPMSLAANKRPTRRPTVNPAGTKLARMAAEKRLGRRWARPYEAGVA